MRFGLKFITVTVLVLTLGLHWALLQTVAWTGMIISYSQENSIRDAISMTFDGEHPCSMCKTIKQGRTEEQQPEKIAPVNKLPLAVVWQVPVFRFDSDRALIPCSDTSAPRLTEAPPKPRPKAFSPSCLA